MEEGGSKRRMTMCFYSSPPNPGNHPPPHHHASLPSWPQDLPVKTMEELLGAVTPYELQAEVDALGVVEEAAGPPASAVPGADLRVTAVLAGGAAHVVPMTQEPRRLGLVTQKVVVLVEQLLQYRGTATQNETDGVAWRASVLGWLRAGLGDGPGNVGSPVGALGWRGACLLMVGFPSTAQPCRLHPPNPPFLLNTKGSCWSGIVFVTRRLACWAVHMLLSTLPCTRAFLRTAAVTGYQQRTGEAVGVRVSEPGMEGWGCGTGGGTPAVPGAAAPSGVQHTH